MTDRRTKHTSTPLILRCLQQFVRVDWKALAVVLTALAGIGGAMWNWMNAAADRMLAYGTQKGAYEIVSQHIEVLDRRLASIERAHGIVPAETVQADPDGLDDMLAETPAPSPLELKSTRPMPTFDRIERAAQALAAPTTNEKF